MQKLNIAFYIPGQIGSYNYPQIFQTFDAARITDIAYQVEVELSGQAPSKGDLQFLVNDPGHNSDGTVPCGLNGNPVRLGTDVDTYSSCMVGVSLGTPTPQWGVFFHEMGHNFTLASNRFTQFVNGSNVPNSNDAYVEGLATGVGIYVAQMMKSRAAQYGISPDILNSILFSVWRFGSTPDLDSYVQNGSNYSTINANVLDDILTVIGDAYGYDALYRFYSVFLPGNTQYPFTIDSDSAQATLFVAAMSAATGSDLRTQFQANWGFPVDQTFYDAIYPQVSQLIGQRGSSSTAAATPTFSLAPGTYTTTQNVSLSDATPGATIYYTTDGSTPAASSTPYIGPVTVSATTTIEAIALATGYSPSAVATGIYTITVQKLAQTIAFGALANKVLGDPDFNVSATASSGLTVTFAASGNCTVTGSTVHITGAGSCTITASQAGDGTYSPAANVQQSFSILTSGVLAASGWRVLYVDSQETGFANQGATNAIDGNPATMWVTEWCNSAPATPHEIQIDLGANYIISGFQYLQR
ncbi:MAG: chitobiase/beta-hexosaminidase C-terminal domain-containing protein, partial [Terriglobales bacterium]